MSVKINHLTKVYGSQKAVNDVSLMVNKGDILGFLGPNGAGKSTTMKIMACYLPQTSGDVEVCGHDVIDNPMDVRKKVGYLPEHNPLYDEMYVKEYLAFVAGIHKLKNKRQRVAEMIEMTGLQIEQKKRIGELSKGYRQRVGLAQAMIHDPEVLILDEPTTGLDPNQIVEIRNLIKQLGEEKTVILSSHILHEVEAICNRIVIINHGKLVANDKTENLNQSMSTKTVLLVEFDKKASIEDLQKIKGVIKAIVKGPMQYEIHANTKTDVRPAISKFAATNNMSILALQKQALNLENIFQELTNK